MVSSGLWSFVTAYCLLFTDPWLRVEAKRRSRRRRGCALRVADYGVRVEAKIPPKAGLRVTPVSHRDLRLRRTSPLRSNWLYLVDARCWVLDTRYLSEHSGLVRLRRRFIRLWRIPSHPGYCITVYSFSGRNIFSSSAINGGRSSIIVSQSTSRSTASYP